MLQRLPMKGLSIIYEDTDILIADKPYNMLSQKAKEQDLSANEYLLGYLIRSGALSLETFGTFRPSVCNRLDRNTTGLLLMGKTLAGAQMLSEGCGNVPFINFTVSLYPGTLQNRYICPDGLSKTNIPIR